MDLNELPATIQDAGGVNEKIAQQLATAIYPQIQQQFQQHQTPPTDGRIKWNLRNEFVKFELDLDNANEDHFATWMRQFRAFLRASGIEVAGWLDKHTALEQTMTPTTFKRVETMRIRLPVVEREDLEKVLEGVKKIAKSSLHKWTKRKTFHDYHQLPNQPFRQFYGELVEKAMKCDFGEGFCETCQQLAVDERIIDKLVFGIGAY